MSEQRKYRRFSPQQKAEIVLAGLRGDRSVRDVGREYQIAETLSDQWRERLLDGGPWPARSRSVTPSCARPSSSWPPRSPTGCSAVNRPKG